MAGRFRLLTDNHVRQQLVEALTSRGWDVVRAIDAFPERTSDEVLFAHAAATGRVFVSTDEPDPFAYPIRYIKPQADR